MDQETMPHGLQLREGRELTVTGVTEVIRFDEAAVALRTTLGELTVHGQELQLRNLSQDGGRVSVEGAVTALIYQQSRPSWRQRLFG